MAPATAGPASGRASAVGGRTNTVAATGGNGNDRERRRAGGLPRLNGCRRVSGCRLRCRTLLLPRKTSHYQDKKTVMTDLQLFVRKPSLALLLPLILVLGLTVLAACGGDDAPPEPTAAVTEAATEAPTEAATEAPTEAATEAPTEAATPIATATPTATATEAPTAAPPAPGYPREVVDLVGRTVTIPDKPSAIVAISPTATELVYAVGGTIIGRTQSVNYPPEAAEAPSVGTAYQPNFESILALEPDLVVADSTIHIQPAVRDALEALGVPVVFAGAASVDEVLTGLTLLGEVLDNPAAAAEAVAVIEAARASARETLAAAEVSAVLIIGDRDRSLYGAKGTSYAGSILDALGIVNPASEQPDSGPSPASPSSRPRPCSCSIRSTSSRSRPLRPPPRG